MQELRVGIIGCGFMGRTHSNAYRRLNNFFPVRAPAGAAGDLRRDRERTEANSRDVWGYERAETDWRQVDGRQGYRPDRHLRAELARTRRSPWPRRKAGKMMLCEKPLAMNAAEGEEMVRAVEAAGVAEHDFVQLPARAADLAGEADHRRRPHRAGVPLPRRRTCRTGRFRPTCRRAATRLWRLDVRVPAAASPATCWRTPSTRRCG